MKKIIASIIILVCFMGNFTTFAEKNDIISLYVQNNATDDGDGSFSRPFKTLEQARDKIREIKKQGNYPSGGINVLIRGGQYSFPESFKLNKEDSGKEGAPVCYSPYGNEEVKFVGGAEITLGDCQNIEDENIKQRLVPEAANKVLQIDLKARGIQGYGEMYVTGHSSYYSNLYGVTKKGPPVPEIFYNGEAMPLARYPNDGYMLIGRVIDKGDVLAEWSKEDKATRNDPPEPMTFGVEDDRIKRWENANQAWVFGYWKHDWSDQTTPVKTIDVNAKSIKTVYGCHYEITKGQRFYIYNLIEELDVPGEWFYDNDTGILYLYPLDNNKNSLMLLSFSQKPVINMDNVEYVQFREISISGTRSNGISASKCKNVKISYCSIGNLSSEGISALDSYNFTIEGCHIYSTGAKGINLSGGDRNTLERSENLVFNNWIHDFGRLVKTYEGAVTFGGVGNTIKNNLMHDGAHLCITPGGNDNLIEYNEIHSVLKESSDMGAIYFNVGMTSRGNVIRNNLFRDLVTDSKQGHKVQAIYLDNSSSGALIEQNIFYNIGGDGVFVNGGRNNTVQNNIFANLQSSVTLNASGLAVSWGWYGAWLDGSRTYGLKGNNVVPYTSELYSKYPNMNDIMEDDPPYPKYNVLQNNVSYNVEKEYNINPLEGTGTGITIEDMYELSTIVDGISGKKDVGFVSVKNNNFNLKQDSEVFTKLPEFQPIEAQKIGLITSKLRTLLSNNSTALVIGKPRTYVNWDRKFIDEGNYDVVPFINNDTAYVPLRFLFESLGASVEWKDDKAIIDYNGNIITIAPDSNIAEASGGSVELAGEVITRDGRIFVPLRSCSELMNKNVFWDDIGLIIISDENLEGKLTEDMIYDLSNRL